MNDVTFMILKIVVSVAVALITVYVVPYLKELKNNEEYSALFEMVEVAVHAAEQTIKTGGADKKEAVMMYLTEWAKAHNITVSQEQINQLVEAAVFSMNQIKEG